MYMNGFAVCGSDSLLMALIEISPRYAGRQRLPKRAAPRWRVVADSSGDVAPAAAPWVLMM